MLWLTQMMCCKVYIGQTTDVEENLDPTIFDVIDSIVIFWELEHARNDTTWRDSGANGLT